MNATGLATLVDQRLAAIEEPDNWADSWQARAYYEKLRAVIDELIRDHDASFSRLGGFTLSCAGVESSSTISELQALKNWIRAARSANGAEAAAS